MSARSAYLSRLEDIGLSLDSPAVVDKTAADVAHNKAASVLRRGLAVVQFSTLEDFLRNRTGELLQKVGNSGVGFKDLPDKLREAALRGALEALNFRVRTLKSDKAEETALIQEEARCIASTADQAFQFSKFTLGHKGSNLGKGDVKEVLASFGLHDAWLQLDKLAGRLGFLPAGLEIAFETGARRRHAAAHVAAHPVTYSELSDFQTQSKAIAVSFDALLSGATYLCVTRNALFAAPLTNLAGELGIYKVEDRQNGKYRVMKEGRLSALASGTRHVCENIAVAKSHTSGALAATYRNGSLLEWRSAAVD